METLLECTLIKSWARQAQIYIAIPLGVVGGLLIGPVVDHFVRSSHSFSDMSLIGFFVVAVLVLVEILIWQLTKGKLVITRAPDGRLEFEVHFPGSGTDYEKGKWACEAYYNKTEVKYGMHQKHLALCLFCNNQPFCLLRHDLSAIAQEPADFTYTSQLFNPGGPEYWCRKLREVKGIIESEIK